MNRVLALALSSLLVAACADAEPFGPAGRDDVVVGLRAEPVVQQRSLDDCDPGDQGCTWIRVAALRLQPTEVPAIAAIQHRLDAEMRRPVLGEEPESSFDDLASSFLSEYRQMRQEFPDFDLPWSFERTAELLWSGSEMASFAIRDFSFLGGAHPNTVTTYRVFSTRSGRELQLADLFSPGYEPVLKVAAERAFRAYHGVSPEQSLQDAGFWFDEGFTLAANWAVTADGFTLYYNPYEVAAYAVGPTRITIPRARLETIIKPDGPWGRP